MGRVVEKTEYTVYWAHSGFPTQTSGPFKTFEEAVDCIASYKGDDKMKRNAYVRKAETVSEIVGKNVLNLP